MATSERMTQDEKSLNSNRQAAVFEYKIDNLRGSGLWMLDRAF